MLPGSTIRAARQADGLTQAALARRMGITQPSVARLEAAGDEVTIATLRRALTAMGRALEWHVRAPKPSYDETLLVENLKMSPAERLELMQEGYAGFRELAIAGEQARARARATAA